MAEKLLFLISIIIPGYNRKEMLDQCLTSVFQQNYPFFEVIVVDDGSSDGTVDFVKQKYPTVKLIVNFKRFGPPYCRNQGILASRGEILLFLDSDTEFMADDVLDKLNKFLSENEKIGEVGGEMIPDKKEMVCGRNILKNGMSTVVGCEPEEIIKKCDFLPTSNCAVRKEIAFQIGGFDPYYDYGAEDKDFGYRIQQRGFQNYINYKTAVLHKPQQGKVQKDRLKLNPYNFWGRKNLRFLIKHRLYMGIFLLLDSDLKSIIKKYIFTSLIIYRLLGDKKRKEKILFHFKSLIFAPAWLVADYGWNLIHLFQTLKSRDRDFLTQKEMDKFNKL